MKNTGLLKLLAVMPLLVWSCSKTGFVQEEIPTPTVAPDPWTAIPLPEVSATGSPATVTAGNVATKSQLDVNGSHASVIWSAGDSFKMYAYTNGDNSVSSTTFSTGEGGDAVAEFTGTSLASGKDNYYSFYPASACYASSKYGTPQDFIIGMTLPPVQVADPGHLAEGANLSFARSNTPTPTENLHFTNVPSIIKFRLSGSIVTSIKKVSFIGTKDLAGDMVLRPNGSHLEVLPGVSFPPRTSSRSVSLTLTDGVSFAEGKDYYIAVAPSSQDSFTMVFENGDGTQKITKISSKLLTLNRSEITDFGTIDLGTSFDDNSMAPIAWHTHDPNTTTKYATIAVIPDGYTKNEMAQYVTDANAGLTALFGTEPYKTYKKYFNVWILKVASRESGARISDGTPAEQTRDCFFQSTWKQEKYDNMSANADRVFQFVKDNCPDIINNTHTIADVPVLIMINDTRYGGIARNYSDGSTYCMVPKTYDGSDISWYYPAQEANGPTTTRSDGLHNVTTAEITAMGGNNVGTWCNTLVHEFGGHSIGKLGDEYWYPNNDDKSGSSIEEHSWTVPMKKNVSATSVQTNVPWAGLYDSDITTKMAGKSGLYAARIGIFQGADVSTFNRWRSEKISCMIDNRFYFSTWQRYLIVNRIMALAGLTEKSISDFLDSDVPTDPKRDVVSSPVMYPAGVSNLVPPRPVPMLPPPVYIDRPAL